MALKLNFSKVSILSFTRTPALGTAKICCLPTKTVCKAMGWEDLPEWQKEATPVGELAASLVEFTPTHPDLAKHAIDLTSTGVYSFELVRKQIKKGKTANKSKSYRMELHCSVDFVSEDGARKLEYYMQTVNESTMRVTYEREAEQEELPMESADGQGELEGIVQDVKRKRATAAEAD